jgi:hypothetical protein
MKINSYVINLCVLAILSLAARQAAAFDTGGMDWGSLGNDFKIENNQLMGSFKHTESWKGLLCNGKASYNNELTSTIDKLDLKLTDNNTLQATLNLSDIRINLEGTYESELTFCQSLEGSIPVNIDSLQILSSVVMTDGVGNAPPTVTVHVQSTKLGLIQFGDVLPKQLEQYFTNMVNAGLKKVWASFLGDWLDTKISDYLTKNFPQGQEN